MNILKNFPESYELLKWYTENGTTTIHEVNGHIHTPYSFSAFSQISEAFELAISEGIKILGINDFYTPKGYSEFYKLALENKIFPLFNIEFISLSKDLQELDQRVNDPNNPGRTYFSGKGLDYPFSLSRELQEKLNSVINESMKQVTAMVEKTNELLKSIDTRFLISVEEIQQNYAKELVRERHIAKILRIKISEKYSDSAEQKEFLTQLFSGKECKSDPTDFAAVENEIRGNLLKKGGKAFVEEDSKAFLALDEVIEIITAAGGIPCYPVLLDDPKGNFTDFESDWKKMRAYLRGKNVNCIELIPTRNSLEIMSEFVDFFKKENFIITFGTEHNTPVLTPLKVSCRGKAGLTPELKETAYNGACIVAAHQYLKARGKTGYIDNEGKPRIEKQEELMKLGKALIEYYFQS